MDPSTLPALPVALNVAGASAAISAFFLIFATSIAKLPGFGPTDETRSDFLRLAHGLLTLGVVLFLAWSQNVAITRAEVVPLLAAVFVASATANLTYVSVKAVAAKRAGNTTVSLTPAGQAALAQVQSSSAADSSALTASTQRSTMPASAPIASLVVNTPTVPESPASAL